MIAALRRKLGHLLADPILRRWLLGRALRLTPAPAPFVPGRPPYLTPGSLQVEAKAGCWPFGQSQGVAGCQPLTLELPGVFLTLDPAAPQALFETEFPDLETSLAVHRFAWLPLCGANAPVSWVFSLLQEWCARYGTPDGSWAWHPYSVAERAINLMAFGHDHGLPADFQPILAAHGQAIAQALEYFGDHYTGNHLANNGRGLYLLGLELDMPACRDLGLTIVLREAERIFSPHGLLVEGSSHYHLLLTRNYLSLWLAARRFNRPEVTDLERIAVKAWRMATLFALPGGFPTIGDISPDCPPRFLSGLLVAGGPIAGIAATDLTTLDILRPSSWQTGPDEPDWVRLDHGPWSGLWYASPTGWPPMPGHGHQDLGGFEIHWNGHPLFIDPGRGAYGESGEADLYRNAVVHNVLQVGAENPTPINRPYYSDRFRRAVGGESCRLDRGDDWVRLIHHGFRRHGVSRVERHWAFEPQALVLTDSVEGRGRKPLVRRLVTPWPTRIRSGAAEVDTPAGTVRVIADGGLSCQPLKYWQAYGQAKPATAIIVESEGRLPWTGMLRIEVP